MNTITRNAARTISVAAMIVAAALGLAGLANAAGPAVPTTTTTAPAPVGPGYEYYPDTYATPPPTQVPGWQGHHGPNHVN